jgi:hypothetical protein
MRTRNIPAYLLVFIIVGIFSYGCIEPFEARLGSHDQNILVIEGYINAGPGKTRIYLSKVSLLNESETFQYENNAEVYVESDANESFLLTALDQGVYESEELNLRLDRKYRLHVKLQSGKEYRSELLNVKITPSIDSLHWEWKPDRLYIYVNTHDSQDASRFYKWTFQENWEIQVPYISVLEYREDTILDRSVEEYSSMKKCWLASTSASLQFATTQGLTADVINFPITAIPHGSERTRIEYALLAVQHTITEDEYNYLTLIQKNSTQVGSFFDPMPSQLFGNIKNVADADESIIGYIGVYTTESLRLIIHGSELPQVPVQEHCQFVDFPNFPDSLKYYLGHIPPRYLPYETYYEDNNVGKPRVIAVEPYCADCRLRGSAVRPDFFTKDED